MALEFEKTALPGVLIMKPRALKDPRGFFSETFHQKKYAEIGVPGPFVQDNHSHSRKGTLRGLHYQIRHSQGKLVYVMLGEIFDVAVDIRRGSPTFGQWVGARLSSENRFQIYLPEGFAHGFCVLSEEADVIYKCTDFYSPEDERGVFWADPYIKIAWPAFSPILSKKDAKNPGLDKVPKEDLPVYQSA